LTIGQAHKYAEVPTDVTNSGVIRVPGTGPGIFDGLAPVGAGAVIAEGAGGVESHDISKSPDNRQTTEERCTDDVPISAPNAGMFESIESQILAYLLNSSTVKNHSP
jgi:hypothetical protein